MTMTQSVPDMPSSWEGSEPEWITFIVLQQLGKIPDEELVPDSKILISGIDEVRLMESNLAKPHKLPG